MKLLLFALAAAALMKKSNPGIGKVTTNNPAVQFFYNGIKIDGKLIPGTWWKDSDGILFLRKEYGYKEDQLLGKYFRISNETDITTDYFEITTIYFNIKDNNRYYPYAKSILEEADGKKDAAFQKWIDSLTIEKNIFNGLTYMYIYRNGKLLGILSEHPYQTKIYQDQKRMYKLKKFVDEIGFDNAFAAYL